MEKQSKFLGKTYDGIWTVVDYVKNSKTNLTFIIENNYNHNRYYVQAKTIRKLDNGETTVSSIIHKQLKLKIDRRIKQ